MDNTSSPEKMNSSREQKTRVPNPNAEKWAELESYQPSKEDWTILEQLADISSPETAEEKPTARRTDPNSAKTTPNITRTNIEVGPPALSHAEQASYDQIASTAAGIMDQLKKPHTNIMLERSGYYRDLGGSNITRDLNKIKNYDWFFIGGLRMVRHNQMVDNYYGRKSQNRSHDDVFDIINFADRRVLTSPTFAHEFALSFDESTAACRALASMPADCARRIVENDPLGHFPEDIIDGVYNSTNHNRLFMTNQTISPTESMIVRDHNYLMDEVSLHPDQILQAFNDGSLFRLSRWERASDSDRERLVKSAAQYFANNIGITTPFRVQCDKGKLRDDSGYCQRDYNIGGYLVGINTYKSNMIRDKAILATIAHEMWHVYQHQRANNPRVLIDFIYKKNFDNYVGPGEDFLRYKNQPVEVDAIAFEHKVDELSRSAQIAAKTRR